MDIDIQELAKELGKLTPFFYIVGPDYIEVQGKDEETIDNIVVKDGNVVWGMDNEYMLTPDKPVYLARAIASTLQDSI